jgi:hypothetical protein
VGWQARDRHIGTMPSAEGRLWQSEDGHLGILLANYVDTEIPFTYRLDPTAFGLKSPKYQLTEITPQGAQPIGTVAGPIERTDQLAPRKIKLIELAP